MYKNDIKEKELAKLIATHSININPNTQVYIKYKSLESLNLVKRLALEIQKRGGIPFPHMYNKELEDYLLSLMSEDSVDPILENIEHDNKKYDAFISIGSNDEYTRTKKDNYEVIKKYKQGKRLLEEYKKGKNWLLLNYPSIVDANYMNMTYEEFYNYAFEAMAFDFTPIMSSVIELKDLIARTEYVKIRGDNVDLEFYKNGIPAVDLVGRNNLPDGEVYTSPIVDSANGIIKYNVPSPKDGLIYEDITLKFKDGRVVDFDCKDHQEEFIKHISIDDGANKIGEFAFGFNPMIKQPMKDILFDEKLSGSFHIALGKAYKNAFNGNYSALHWDMIYLNEQGNCCDVYFDNDLVYSNGLFIPEKIRKLNK